MQEFAKVVEWPLVSGSDFGTESDGTSSLLYCHYCYLNGSFTDPGATVDQMAERAAVIIEQMFEMPLEKAKEFSRIQIQNLYRWTGRKIPFCESCGMPLVSDSDAGTEKDGSLNHRYCTYCYQNGEFTDPDLTLEGMIRKYAPIFSDQYGVPVPKQKRWLGNLQEHFPDGDKTEQDISVEDEILF